MGVTTQLMTWIAPMLVGFAFSVIGWVNLRTGLPPIRNLMMCGIGLAIYGIGFYRFIYDYIYGF